jgi:lipopolysaccharide export system protein LptA
MSPSASAALALAVCFGFPFLAAAQTVRETEPVAAAAASSAPAPTPAPGAPETTETEILATLGATFNSKDRIAVFTGDVRVNDPRFQLSCDKLTVYLNKSASSGGPLGGDATPAPATPPPLASAPGAAPSPTPQSGGGIDHAIAEGHVIIVQQRAATAGGEAKRSVGRGDWGMFDNKSGDMVLKGTPSVEQNENTHVATSPDTVMTMRKDNSLTTVGPSRTVIVQRKSDEVTGPGGAPAPGAAPGGHKHGHQQPPAATPAA